MRIKKCKNVRGLKHKDFLVQLLNTMQSMQQQEFKWTRT